MSRKQMDKKIGMQTEQNAGVFLFGMKGLTESQALDMRTRINSEKTLRALLFYAVLKESLKCNEAGMVKDCLERMFIAEKGRGRIEAVEILRQQFPRVREVEKGYEGFDKFVKDIRERLD